MSASWSGKFVERVVGAERARRAASAVVRCLVDVERLGDAPAPPGPQPGPQQARDVLACIEDSVSRLAELLDLDRRIAALEAVGGRAHPSAAQQRADVGEKRSDAVEAWRTMRLNGGEWIDDHVLRTRHLMGEVSRLRGLSSMLRGERDDARLGREVAVGQVRMSLGGSVVSVGEGPAESTYALSAILGERPPNVLRYGDRPAWGRDEVAKGWPIVLAMESALDAFGAVRAAAAAAHAHVEPIVGQHRAGFQGSVVRVVDARRAFSARNVVVVEPIVGELPPSCSPGGVGGHSYTAKEAARNWPIVLAGPVAAGRMDPAAPRAVGCGPASEAGA